MRCYAAVEDIDYRLGSVKCEITCMSVEECKTISLLEIETRMTYISLSMIEEACKSIKEGDIIVVEYNYFFDRLTTVYEKADDEKQRRMEFYSKM